MYRPTVLALVSGTHAVSVPTAEALPYLCKYTLDCAACHTAPPRLNTFGERFLEKRVSAAWNRRWCHDRQERLRQSELGRFRQLYRGPAPGQCAALSHHFKQQNPPTAEAGTVHNNSELGFPEVFSLFTTRHRHEKHRLLCRARIQLGKVVDRHRAGLRDVQQSRREQSRQYSRGKNRPSATLFVFHSSTAVDFVGERTNSSTSTVQRAGLFPLQHQPRFTACTIGRALLSHPTPLALQRGRRNRHWRGRPSAIGSCIRSAS